MIGYVSVSCFSHFSKFFSKSFRDDKVFRISFGFEFYFSGFQSFEVFKNIKFYNQSFIRYLITCLFQKMIFYLKSMLIKFILADVCFYFFSDESISFFPCDFIFVSDVSYSDTFPRAWIIEISLDNFLVRKLFDIHRYRFYQKFSFDFECHTLLLNN